MNVVTLAPVRKFINGLDDIAISEVGATLYLLRDYGHKLGMPHAKPIGQGLIELRVDGILTLRFLYGFCNGEAIILLGFKKERPRLRPQEIKLAKTRLTTYCA